MKKENDMPEYADNPKAHFDYEILETIEAGIVLKGYEVKSIKTGRASIKGAYVRMLNGEPYLVGANIAAYQPANMPGDYDPPASRKLLLSKKQISNLIGFSQSQGLTLVPLKFYDKKGRIKLLIGIAKGKKKYDKRETIKKRDIARSQQRGIDE
ncbi:MAG: SsrA-binding protein [Candidatus Yanofskybacteria bacterium GW2011_GWA2_44_10]|uniref:SsrA-binding protein n=2 Tax=Candidatus Yanofskyibacteriota TaxID=1752733 RepID=A0A0G1L3R0_9BACT|nr:MAG: SsrA-binding protein [Candidatus Yanofskybacteria bacterium GW2011_GWA2_44_10]KKT90380.1 MAG: SsrA-binding protein [Candidatus Yanofskybacteria bacterium GW2011_GWB1_45_11]